MKRIFLHALLTACCCLAATACDDDTGPPPDAITSQLLIVPLGYAPQDGCGPGPVTQYAPVKTRIRVQEEDGTGYGNGHNWGDDTPVANTRNPIIVPEDRRYRVVVTLYGGCDWCCNLVSCQTRGNPVYFGAGAFEAGDITPVVSVRFDHCRCRCDIVKTAREENSHD